MAMACTEKNPFFKEWDTPYGTAPFSEIKTEHYLPAFKEGIKQEKAEIQAIIDCKEEPTFQNTIGAYEKAGALLAKVTGVFFNPEKQLEGLVRYLMIRLNPTCYIVTSLRNAMLYNRSPILSWFVLWGIAGLALSALGVHLIYKYERRYVKSV